MSAFVENNFDKMQFTLRSPRQMVLNMRLSMFESYIFVKAVDVIYEMASLDVDSMFHFVRSVLTLSQPKCLKLTILCSKSDDSIFLL